ncbi:hypothetical protein ACOME3_008069 [Neoechinorhynchus agilis]
MACLAQDSGIQVFAQTKRRRARRRNRREKQQQQPIITSTMDSDLWYRLQKKLEELINQNQPSIEAGENPFNAPENISGQEILALKQIKVHLNCEQPARALALFRAGCNSWPSDERFQVNIDDNPYDEIRALRYIFDTYCAIPNAQINEGEDSVDSETSDDDQIEDAKISETHFHLRQFVHNSFINACRRDPHIFVETLFPKSDRIAYEINEGYGSFIASAVRRSNVSEWTPEEDITLKTLFLEADELRNTVGLGLTDIATYIVEKFPDLRKTRRQIQILATSIGLISSAKDLKTDVKRKLTDVEVAELKRLIESTGIEQISSKQEMDAFVIRLKNVMEKGSSLKSRSGASLAKEIKKLLIYKPRRTRKVIEETKSSTSSSDYDSNVQQEAERIEVDDSVLFLESDSDNETINSKRRRVLVDSDEESLSNKNESMANFDLSADLSIMAYTLLQKGNLTQDQLNWLITSLNDMQDMKSRGFSTDALALVPLLSSQFEVCRNNVLKPLLKKCGLRAPVGHQESFWRLKEDISLEELKDNVLVGLSNALRQIKS